MRRRKGALGAPRAAVAALVGVTAMAAPRLAPPAEACPVSAYSGKQLCSAEMNALLEKATGEGLGNGGPSIAQINDGCNNPKPPQKVPFDMPCVLLKAVGVTESNWRQFKVSACGQTGPTVISFDCGYGVMQITSGMSGGAGFDPQRVSKEIGYNVGTGMKIMGSKWSSTPCIGDNEPAILEDWYYATWAYNGFCYCNNPNNSKFPGGRPPYNGPGSLSRGSYPYQEIVWGLIKYPLKDTYEGQDVSYPSKSAIGQDPGKIPMPTPAHSGECGPVVPPHPDLWPAAAIEGLEDRFADASSSGISDAFEGQGYRANLYLKNQGTAVAKDVEVEVWIEEPFVEAVSYAIESDGGHVGEFSPNDANENPENPPHEKPGQRFVLGLYALAPGETKRIALDVAAKGYSIGLADAPDVRFWVKSIEGFYAQDDFSGKVTNEGGFQTFGPHLQAFAPVDVFSQTRWEWNTDRLEGWRAAEGGEVAVDLDAKGLAVGAAGADSPEISFDAGDAAAILIRARRDLGEGPIRLLFTTGEAPEFDEARGFDFDLEIDGAFHDVQVPTDHPAWSGEVTGLRVLPGKGGEGVVVLDHLRAGDLAPPESTGQGSPGGLDGAGGDGLLGGDPFEPNGGLRGGCACEAAGSPARQTPPLGALLGGLLLGALAHRRRR